MKYKIYVIISLVDFCLNTYGIDDIRYKRNQATLASDF